MSYIDCTRIARDTPGAEIRDRELLRMEVNNDRPMHLKILRKYDFFSRSKFNEDVQRV